MSLRFELRFTSFIYQLGNEAARGSLGWASAGIWCTAGVGTARQAANVEHAHFYRHSWQCQMEVRGAVSTKQADEEMVWGSR